MRRKAAGAGIDISLRELRASLAGIQETVLLGPGERGRPRARRILTDIDPVHDGRAQVSVLLAATSARIR